MARASIKGTIQILRRDYSVGKGLRYVFWELIHSSLLSIYDKRRLFSICQILYKEIDSFIVDLPVPCVPLNELNKKLVLKHLGDGKILIHREGRFKIQLATKLILNKKGKSDDKAKLKLKINAPEEAPPMRAPAMRAPAMRAPAMRAPAVSAPAMRAPKVAAPEPPVINLDPLVTRPNKRTIKFKLSKSKLQKITSSSAESNVRIDGTTVTIPLNQEVYPLRYVKMLLKRNKVRVSRVPFERIPKEGLLNGVDGSAGKEDEKEPEKNEPVEVPETEPEEVPEKESEQKEEPEKQEEKEEETAKEPEDQEPQQQSEPAQPEQELEPEQPEQPEPPKPKPKLKLKLNLKS